MLHLGADGSLDVGVAAERWADDEPDRVVRGFPGRIGDDVPMLLAGEPWAPEELTAWLVRWVVDRVAEREGGLAEAIAVTRPASWDADRTELLAGALAEQDLDATFLTTARAAEWHSDESGTDGAATVASAAACGAALALRAGGAAVRDVAARVAALARVPQRRQWISRRPERRGRRRRCRGRPRCPRRAATAPGVGRPPRPGRTRRCDPSAEGDPRAEGDRAEGDPVDGSGAHRAGGSTTAASRRTP